LSENDSDQELLEQIKGGSTQALSLLFKKYYQQLCRFSFAFVPENEVVEELAANVFINLWENKEKVVIYVSLKSYLYRSAKNQALSYRRKKKAEIHSLDEGHDLSDNKDQIPENIYIENELNIQFIRAFQKLSPRAMMAFKLHRFDGLKYSEIAEIMDISVSAVEKNITSALKTLYKELLPMTTIR